MPLPIRPERWFWFAFTIAVACILSPFWLDSQIPAFRDGFHFYYPQAVWLDACYSRGEYFPQWNPNEGLGSSVAGQPTWQLYYPLRAIWLVPALDVAQRYALFVAVHLLFAAAGMLRAGEVLQWTPSARWLAAIAFALGCPVLFQLNNLIYLCSATWVAWGLFPIVRLVGTSGSNDLVTRWHFYGRIMGEISVAGCLMTLAGDPHGAVNFAIVVLAALAYRCWLLYFGDPARALRSSQNSINSNSPGSQRLWLPLLAVLLLVLTIYQTQAALPWYQLSSRAGAKVDRTDSFHPAVAEILNDAALVQPQRTFDFSLSPWNLPTVLWPTWAGHYQPTHSRWVQAIPSEGRMWIPSLYIGIIPAMLGLYALLRKRDRSAIERFLIGLCLLATLLAMGNYSLVWLLRNIMNGLGATGFSEQLPTDAKGSLYGLLTAFIPGYDGFRYPAKWSVWIVASFAVLAGCGFNRLLAGNFSSTEIYRPLIRFIAISGFLGVVVLIVTQIGPLAMELQSWLKQAVDPLLGSPEPVASIRAVARSLLQPALVLVVVLVLLRLIPKVLSSNTYRLSWLVVLLALVDLACLAPQWITSTSAPAYSENLEIAGRAATLCWANSSRAEIKLISQSNSPELLETLQLQEIFQHGKLNHLQGRAALHASGSIEPQAIIVLKRWLQRNDSLQSEQPKLNAVLRALGVTQRLICNQTGQLTWKTVGNAGPLCEFFPDGGKSSQAVSGKWLSSEELHVDIDLSQTGSLLVRQLNDGGWRVRSATDPTIEIAPNELFIVCPLIAGRHRIVFCRW